MAKKYGCPFTTYKCLFCDGWHVSKTERQNADGKTTEEVALEKYSGKANVKPDGLDVERIMATKIPDFKYPVAYEEEWIVKMIELFPEFCRLIDNGRFYIACAMGLHRTDIALCTYWVFYAADKGIAPPAICGYRKDKGLTTNKIMRILNAVYRCMTERNGVEPIPEIVFHERKEIIKELSRGK